MADWPESRSKLVRWVGLMVAAVVALYLCWLMLQPFIEVLLWAVVLVIVFMPVHRRVRARVGSPGWSAVVSCLLVVVVILVPLTLVSLAIVREMSHIAQGLQAKPGEGGAAQGGMAGILDSPYVDRALNWVGQYVDLSQFNSEQFIADRLKSLGGAIAGRTLGVVGGVVGIVIEIFFVIFTMYYLFRDGERMREAVYSVLPLDDRRAHEIIDRTQEVISASVYGVLVIALIQGALGGLAFWALGLPSSLLWGVVMVFLSMIPMAGAFVVWVPAALYLLATGAWGKAIILTVWGALVIGSVDNFLRPKLVGEKTRLHELIIFFSVLGGLQVFGVIGLVLGPVVVAITIALLDVLRHADDSARGGPGDEDTLIEDQAELRATAGESA
ncbi:MAG TPA: AI-2E family transporter [Pyrinomonadaceae bacterium]|jgi:predicted PurR-regulated permease PerM|nr:AI-2E family transporter [Pyrinomonadaceae bacterium]